MGYRLWFVVVGNGPANEFVAHIISLIGLRRLTTQKVGEEEDFENCEHDE